MYIYTYIIHISCRDAEKTIDTLIYTYKYMRTYICISYIYAAGVQRRLARDTHIHIYVYYTYTLIYI